MSITSKTLKYAFSRLKKILNIHAYFFILYGYHSGAMSKETIFTLVAALNTSPLPNLGLRQIVTSLAHEHSPNSYKSATEETIDRCRKDVPDGKSPPISDCMEKINRS